jgi:hypothetical protein
MYSYGQNTRSKRFKSGQNCPISENIFMSPLMVLPLVVSMFPVIVALTPLQARM